MKGMKVLVTGASGFVGSHAAEAVLAAGHALRVLSRPASALPPLLGREVERAPADLAEPASLGAAVAGVEGVLHVAGKIRARDEDEFHRVNALGAGSLAGAAAAAGVRRFVLVSSLSARGPAGSAGPVSAYGRSKLAGEEAVRARARRMEVVVVRPTVVYGPRDRSLLPLFRLARRGLRPVLAGAGTLSVVHAADLARGLVALLASAEGAGETLEASDGGAYRMEELVGAVAAAVGRPGPPLVLPRWAFAAAARASDVYGRWSGRPQVFGRDKLVEMAGSWPADPGPFWRAARLAPRFDLAAGTLDTARSYRVQGWLRAAGR
jgi:nucleoside-diphosphate-sugar epimerase